MATSRQTGIAPADNPQAADEAALLHAFRRDRTPDAFEPLLDLALPKIRGVIYRIVLNEDDMNDLVQETMIRAYHKFDSFQGRSAFSTWVCQIGVNQALNHVRKKRPELTEDGNVERDAGAGKERPDRRMIQAEEQKTVDWAMAQLPEHLRSVLVLSVIEEMETDDVAAACGCSKTAVYWRLHKARKKLRQLVAQSN